MPQNNVDTVNILNEADLTDVLSPNLTDVVHLTQGRKATVQALKTSILNGESTDVTDINVPSPNANTITVQAITGGTTNSTTIPTATSTTAGVMSADQATRVATIPVTGIDGSETIVQAGSNVTVTGLGTASNPYTIASTGGGGATNLTVTRTATTVTVNSDTGTEEAIPASTTTQAGVMTAADKVAINTNSNKVGITTAQANAITANTAKETAHPLIDDDTLNTATATNVASAESIKAYVDANAGGGASVFNVTTGTAEFKGEYVGPAPTITETATNGIYDIVVPVGCSIIWFDFKGNASDVNASGNITFNYDNSANATDRRFDVTPFALIGGNANKPLNKFGVTDYVETQSITSNITSILIPNLGGTGTSQTHTFALTIK